MEVMELRPEDRARRMGGRAGLVVGAAAVLAAGAAGAQETASPLPTAPSAVVRPLVLEGGVTLAREQPGVVRLTLDDAIANALRSNQQLVIADRQEQYVHGQLLTVGNALAPNLAFKGYLEAQEIDLAALGFKPQTLNGLTFNGQKVGVIASLVKVNTASAELTLQQALFNVPAFYLYKAARKAVEASNWQTLNTRGGLVIAVGGLYLRALADQAAVDNAAALLKQDDVVYEHAKAAKEAGTGINLDVLRAQTELLNEQQALVSAENAEAKDKIQLNRYMNMPAGQALDLVDTVPFAEFEGISLAEAMKVAEIKRKDLRGYEAQLEVAEETAKAVKFERVPTLGAGGYYGVIKQFGGIAHGNFVAEGQLSFPIFLEAELRGQGEVAAAQERSMKQRIDSTRAQIEGEIRSAMLDVESTGERVKVARSNVMLAHQALDDSAQRFTAGVDDNLPVAEAQSALVGAEAQVIEAEFEYNYAKLTLARNTGVVETQYRVYLGSKSGEVSPGK